MEPPAYTGGHFLTVVLAIAGLGPAMEPPAYTGGHGVIVSDSGTVSVPQWSLRLTPEDTKYRSLDARQLYPPQWSLRLTPEDTAPE